MRSRLLDKLIIGSAAGPFCFGVLIFVLIFVAGDLLFQAAKLIIQQGIPLSVVTRLFFYRLPEVILLTIPMASLLATLLGMSSLNSSSELIALKSLGIPFMRILRPVFLVSVLIAVTALFLNETFVPMASIAADKLMKYEIMKNQASAVQEKVFLREEHGGELKRVLYIDQLDTNKGIMSGIILNDFEDGILSNTITAKSGIYKDMQWWIEDGRIYTMNDEGEVKLLLRFERQKLALGLSPAQLERSTRKPSDMSAHELWTYIKNADGIGGADLSKLWVMFHLKLAVPWACVIMAVLGAGFGASRRGRSGGGVGFGISVVIVFAYYVVMSLCRAFGESGNIPPFVAGWCPNIVFAVLAVYFSLRVDRI